MLDKNIDKDILLLREIQSNFELDETLNRKTKGIYSDVTKRFIDAHMIDTSIENVLINLKAKEIENKDLKEKLEIQGNLTETYKKIADEIENMFGEEFTKLGTYEKDNSTPEKERIAGGINILNKLRKRLDWVRKEVGK